MEEGNVISSSSDDAAEINLENSPIDQDTSNRNSRSCSIDPVLLRLKLFFFLFYGGFGTTFPYLGIYFKQIGLSADSVGILAGIRPLIQCASGPLWALLADKYKARKAVLLFSILAWLVMTILLAFPKPHHVVCKAVNKTGNSTRSEHHFRRSDSMPSIRLHGHTKATLPSARCFPTCQDQEIDRGERSASRDDEFLDRSHLDTNEFSNSSEIYSKDFSSQRRVQKQQSHEIEYKIERDPKELRDVFIIMLILIVVGEFLEAPSFIMIDTALLEHLGDKKSLYGRTRVFGSIGYGIASFSLGAILDRVRYQYCGKTMTNYIILFYIFAAFMIIAFIFASFGISFQYNKVGRHNVAAMDILRLFGTLRHGTFLLIAWFMGFSHGGTMSFLNWYLEDLGASKFMMGVGSSCRSIAIIIGFPCSNYFINKIGHYNMILFALVAYTLSFFGYSVIPNPWYALPIETAQGICYAMSWSACITYLGAAAPPNTAATVQGDRMNYLSWFLLLSNGNIIRCFPHYRFSDKGFSICYT